jgi:putative nucleotidyltransferase with HDIG domain
VSRREEIIAYVRTLPALPTGAGQLLALLQDPDVGISVLIERIEYDPGLTSNLLRLANSAYFAGPRSIGSLREAIVRLGTKRILQLVITSVVAPMARRPVQGYDLPAGQLLTHSVAVAIAGEQIAEAVHLRPVDHLFTAGLLHDLGKIVLGTFVEVDAEPIRRLAFEQSMPFDAAEREVLGIDHAEVGAQLLASWSLPADVVEAVRHHHLPENVAGDSFTVDLVHTADQLILSSGVGAGADGLNYRPSEGAVTRLNLTPLLCETVISRTVDAVEELRCVLDSGGGN